MLVACEARVDLASMPQGVEHAILLSPSRQVTIVDLASMPQGVEHAMPFDLNDDPHWLTSPRCRKALSTQEPDKALVKRVLR